MKKDRVRVARVRAPQDDDIRFFELAVRARATTRSENFRQTGDAGSVSRAVAAIDIVAAHDDARELLGHEVHLVGRLGAAKKPEGRPAAVFEPRGRALERLFPARASERPIIANHWMSQSLVTFSQALPLGRVYHVG